MPTGASIWPNTLQRVDRRVWGSKPLILCSMLQFCLHQDPRLYTPDVLTESAYSDRVSVITVGS